MISTNILNSLEFKKCINKTWNENSIINEFLRVSADTRNFDEGSLFFAIKGERIDAFTLLENVIEKFVVVIFEYNEENKLLAELYSEKNKNVRFYGVKNTVFALQLLARLHVEDWYKNTQIHHLVAISGSNGKTTTKEMLSYILKQVLPGKVESTLKNNNNHIGVPLTLFQINCRNTKIAIVEFGSNHPGEIKIISEIAKPNSGIVTNIGYTHMEFFNDINDVFEEEGLIYKYVNQNNADKSLFLINDDDSYLKSLRDTPITKRFSTTDKNSEVYYKIEGNQASIHLKNQQPIVIKNKNIMGTHNFINMCNAITFAIHFFPELKSEILNHAQNFSPTPNRSEWKKVNDMEVFLDAYNANPSSMKVSLSEFLEYAKSKKLAQDDIVVVIGEMKELGLKSKEYHIDFFKWISGFSLKTLLYVGEFGQELRTLYPKASTFNSADEARPYFQKLVSGKKLCFIKASRSLQLERLLDITKG